MSERPSVDEALRSASQYGIAPTAHGSAVAAVLSDLRAALADPMLREALKYAPPPIDPAGRAARRLLDLIGARAP